MVASAVFSPLEYAASFGENAIAVEEKIARTAIIKKKSFHDCLLYGSFIHV